MRYGEELPPEWVNNKWVNNNWFRKHLAIAPVAAFTVTWLLMYFGAGIGQWWNGKENLSLAGQLVPFGAASYSVIALLWELGVKLWAWYRKDKDIEKARKEGKGEGYKLGQTEGFQSGFEEGFRLGIQREVERRQQIG